MAQVGVFSPNALNIIISKPSYNFSHRIVGYTEGTGMSLAPATDRAQVSYGMKGDTTIVLSPVTAKTLTINLQSTSHSNDILSKLVEITNDVEEYDPFFSITFSDASGMTLMTDNKVVCLTEGEYSFADSVEGRTWTFVLPDPNGQIGGNGKFSPQEAADYETLGGTIPEKWQPE